MRITPKRFATFAVLPLLLMACNPGSLSRPDASTPVAVLFQGASSTASSTAPSQEGDATLTITGNNGTLEITSIEAIVEGVEFECETSTTLACVEYETAPSFVTLPLDTSTIQVATGDVPVGTYTELDFEIDDLDPDFDDTLTERAAKQAVLDEIRTVYPNFPSDASMILTGTFTPTGAIAGTPFETYLEGEIEIEMPLVPALEVVEDADPLALPVIVDPTIWLKRGDDVLELSDGYYREFEVEIENGFTTVEYDEIDDGYDDDRDDHSADESSSDDSSSGS